MNINMPFIPAFELTMSSTEEWKSLENVATLSMNIEENSIDMHIQYDFISALEMICEVRTSFSNFEHQRISLGYENNQRKMLKAHFDILGHANGLEIDYKFLHLEDFVALLRMDFPFQDWTDMHIDVASQIGEDAINLRAGAGINKLKFGANIFKKKTKNIINLIFKNDFINIILDNDSSKIVRITAESHLLDLSMKMLNLNHFNQNILSELQVDLNEDKKIHVYQSSPMKKKSVMIQNIILPFHINTTVVFDQWKELDELEIQSVAIESQFSSDTAKFVEKSFAFDFSVRRCDHCGDFSLSTRLPGRTPLTARATVSSSPTTSSNNLEIFLGTEKEKDYETLMFQHSFKQDSSTVMEKRHIVKFKTFVFEFDTHSSEALQESSKSASIKWGITDEDLKGLGYLMNKEESSVNSETRLILSHPLNNKEDNILAMIIKNEEYKTNFDMKMFHPDKAKQFSLKVQQSLVLLTFMIFFQGMSKLKNTNQKLDSQLMLGYTMGDSGFRFVDGELTFDKTSHSVTAIINSNKAAIKIQVKGKKLVKLEWFIF